MALPFDDQLAELGKVIMLASLLEWDLVALTAQLTSLTNEETMELLSNRQALMRKFKESIKKFEKKIDEFHGLQLKRGAGDIRFLDHKKFIRKVESAFKERDRVAHGIYLMDNKGKHVMYHPRRNVTSKLDIIHLKKISAKIDRLSTDTFPMAAIINERQQEMSKKR